MLPLLGKAVLLTGSTGEIGREIAIGLARNGASDLILPYRDKSKIDILMGDIFAVNANCKVHADYLELSSLRSVKAWAADISRRFGNLSILINNAAVVPPKKEITTDGYEMQFQVNVLSYYALMIGFAEVLKANSPGSRIINVASNYAGDYNFDDLQFSRRNYDSNSAYRQSKQADRMLTWAAVEDELFRNSGVTINACHPGVVTSHLLASLGMQTGFDKPSRGAETPLYLACSPDLRSTTGRYFVYLRETSCPWRQQSDQNRALWNRCKQIFHAITKDEL